MSSLTIAQHKQLLGAVLVYLQDLQAGAVPGAVVDSAELSNAVRSLGAATGLASSTDRSAYEIAPHTLQSIFASAAVPVAAQSSSSGGSDFQAKFAKYLNVLKERGYFAGAAEGSPEYDALVEKARSKLMERSEGGAQGASASASSASASAASNTASSVTPQQKAAAEDLKSQGNTKMTEKQYAEAIRLYGEAIALDGHNAVYYANRAAAHSSLGDHEQAVADAKSAIRVDSTYVKAYSRLGLAYFALGKYREAIDEGYKKGLALEPSNTMMQASLKAAQDKLAAEASSSSSSGPSAEQGAAADGGAGGAGAGGFGNLLQNLMGGAGGAGGAGGMPDLGSMMNNPGFMQMAQQMAQTPQFQQMAQQLASNPDLLNNLGGMFRGAGGGGNQQ